MDADVVVVGCRAAGAATAMLLARNGLRVVAVDRAHFPSDTLSSHQLQPPGVACLRRWGLLDRLVATGLPATREITFDAGAAVLRGPISAYDGVDAMYSPRRTILDGLLVEAAREAGAEVLEGFDVQEVLMDEDRVSGVRGRSRSSGTTGERVVRAHLVIGADGKHSTVAKTVGASNYHEAPAQAAACYAYWAGLDLPTGEAYARPGRVIGAWATHDDLVVTFVGMPITDFADYQADPEGHLLASLDLGGSFGERARAATRVGPVRGTNDLPHRFRTPSGPGWALAGDAGLVMDPSTGQGIGHALQDAEALAGAVTAGLSGPDPLDAALAAYGRQRDEARLPMHEMTAGLASFAPQPGSDELFTALADSPEGTRRFLAVLGGVESPADFFAPDNLAQLLA